MGYVADTFVAGEQPTTAKWNELWSNDASFNDGSGIGSGVITNGKLASTAVNSSVVDWTTSGGVWWQELARTTLGATGSLSVSFTAKKYLQVRAFLDDNGSTGHRIQFNSDTGSNYSSRWNKNGTEQATETSGGSIIVGDTANNRAWETLINIINIASKEKTVITESFSVTAVGAGTAPDKYYSMGKWTNTSNQISSIQFTGSYLATGTEVIVLGHD